MAKMGMIPDDYRAQDDLRCLVNAAKIKADKKRYKAALKLANDQLEAVEDCDPAMDAKEDAKEGEKDD